MAGRGPAVGPRVMPRRVQAAGLRVMAGRVRVAGLPVRTIARAPVAGVPGTAGRTLVAGPRMRSARIPEAGPLVTVDRAPVAGLPVMVGRGPAGGVSVTLVPRVAAGLALVVGSSARGVPLETAVSLGAVARPVTRCRRRRPRAAGEDVRRGGARVVTAGLPTRARTPVGGPRRVTERPAMSGRPLGRTPGGTVPGPGAAAGRRPRAAGRRRPVTRAVRRQREPVRR